MAQQPLPRAVSHTIAKNITLQRQHTAPSAVTVLALMIEFQTDTDSRTSGNGTFLKRGEGWGKIDPAPHDSVYFAQKLQFLSNYFRKVSNGQLTLTGDVWGKVIRLSKQMSAYSPPTDQNDYSALAQCITESWHTADSLYPEIDFSKYNAFLLFHAGAGRDIDLVSLLGFNPTPHDLPTLYFDSSALARSLNNPAFQGIAVDSGRAFIKHTLFLPETESRILPTSPPETLQLSINGILAATFGSYLGLPDLFDTKTGRSAIGQFGLMDGAGMFAYSGIFPPEPSAWEKMYLGWLQPITITSTTTLSLPAVGLYSTGTDTVYKIPITSTEYFLLENRNRDPQGNGQTLTLADAENRLSTLWLGRDTTGFNQYSVSALEGSVVDVEDFDWALPGYIDSTQKYNGGGVLIWHIDERVIEEHQPTNTVNANPALRGVDLEEADGSQDIGQSYGEYTAGSGTEYGSSLDCWFEGNSAPAYKNRFDASTYPNTNSNDGARTLIAFRNFSPRSNRMTVTVEFGSSNTTRVEALERTFAEEHGGYITAVDSVLLISAHSSIYIHTSSGRNALTAPLSRLTTVGGKNGIAAKRVSPSLVNVVGGEGNLLSSWFLNDADNDGVFETVTQASHTTTFHITTLPVLGKHSGKSAIIVGDREGTLWLFDSLCTPIDSLHVGSAPLSFLAVVPADGVNDSLVATTGSRIVSPSKTYETGISTSSLLLVAAKDVSGTFLAAGAKGGRELQILSADFTTTYWQGTLPVDSIISLAAGDVNNDGYNEIIVNGSNSLYVLNKYGVLNSNFPVSLSASERFIGAPLLADMTGDGSVEIVTISSKGILRIYNNEGKLINGMPVQYTESGNTNIALAPLDGTILLGGIHERGILTALRFEAPWSDRTVLWTQEGGSSFHQSFATTPVVLPSVSQELLPSARAYNWPNPVYGQETHIRYYLSEPADVKIKIFDIAGTTITELRGVGHAGFENEIIWNVKDIQTGIYFAHIEAKSSGRSASTIIKIAVVK